MSTSKLNTEEFCLLKKKIIGNFEWCLPVLTENFQVSEGEEGIIIPGPLSQNTDKQYVQKVVGIRVADKETKEEKRIYWHFTEEEKKEFSEHFGLA